MATEIVGVHIGPRVGPCSHSATGTAVEVITGKKDRMLRRHACWPCHRSWWECDGTVIELSEALRMIKDAAPVPPRASSQEPQPSSGHAKLQCHGSPAAQAPHPEEAPADLMALLSWVGQAIGTDFVVFAASGPAGWQTLCRAQAADGPISADNEDQRQSLAAEAHRYEGLLSAVAKLHRPTELTKKSLATICPGLVAAGVRRVVGAPVYGPSGSLAAVIVAAYGAHGRADRLTPIEQAAAASPETVGCMGKLLTSAHRHLRSLAPTLPLGASPGR